MITRLGGAVLLEADDVDYLARALEMLGELLAVRGAAPSQKLTVMTETLRSGVNTGATRLNAGVGTRIVDADDDSAHTPWHAFLDTKRTADILGITPNGVRDLARRGSLPARRVGRQWMLDAAAVIRRAESSSG